MTTDRFASEVRRPRVYGTSPTVVWFYRGAPMNAYEDITVETQRLEGDPYTALMAVDDYLYIGSDHRFDMVFTWLARTATTGGVTWEFSTSSGFVEFEPDQLVEFRLDQAKEYAQWGLENTQIGRKWQAVAAGTATGFASVPGTLDTTTNLYWVRLKLRTASTEAVQFSAIRVRPYATLATPEMVQEQLQLPTADGFDDESLPSSETVERFIRGAEDELFRVTGHYYRPEVALEELDNFRPYGMKLRNVPVLDLLRFELWDGSSWDPKREGRDQDWHYVPETGMIYIATIFLDAVPPQLRRGWSQRRNQGSFKRGVRSTYVYGYDPTLDRFAVEVGRTVVKQAAVDVVTSWDFNQLLPTTVDRMRLSERVSNWRDDVAEFKSRYAKLTMF